jgi:hypothetical protein
MAAPIPTFKLVLGRLTILRFAPFANEPDPLVSYPSSIHFVDDERVFNTPAHDFNMQCCAITIMIA